MHHPTLWGNKCARVQCWLLSVSPAISGRWVACELTFSSIHFPPLTKVLSFSGHKGIRPYESSVLGEIWLGKLCIVIGPILKLMSSVGQRKSETRLHCVAGLPWNSNQSCLRPPKCWVLQVWATTPSHLSLLVSCPKISSPRAEPIFLSSSSDCWWNVEGPIFSNTQSYQLTHSVVIFQHFLLSSTSRNMDTVS